MRGSRIVVTGMGLLSPLGISPDEFWDGLIAGKRAFAPVERFDVSAFCSRLAALVSFDPDAHLDPRASRRMNRLSQMTVTAARAAARESGLTSRERAGVFMGTGFGCMETTEAYFEKLHGDPPHADPFLFAEAVANAPSAHVAIELGCRGPNAALAHGDGAAGHALVHGAFAVAGGRAEAALCGGMEEMTLHTFNVLDKLCAMSASTSPRGPFDEARSGFIPGEGVGVFAVESLDAARARRANLLGEILGFGLAHDTTARPTDWSVSHEACARVMRLALAHAGVAPEGVDVVVACANGTFHLDTAEARAVAEVFGKHPVCVTAVKGHVGEFAGAGAFSVAAALLMLRRGKVFPVAGLVSPDPRLPGMRFVCEAEDVAIRRVLVNFFSAGGACASVLFGRAEE